MTEEEQELVEVMAGAMWEEQERNPAAMDLDRNLSLTWATVLRDFPAFHRLYLDKARAALQAAKAAGYTITRSARHGIVHGREGFEGEPTP